MKTILSMVRDLREDESGATFIEYTVLLGVVLAVGIAAINGMGKQAATTWSDMTAALAKIGKPD
jgi:Flp pilus assembly pilin Flp